MIMVWVLGIDLAPFLWSLVVFAVFVVRNDRSGKKSMQGCSGVLSLRWL